MSYRIEVRPAAARALQKVHPDDRKRLQGAIALLGMDPRPPGAKRLRGRDAMRVRVGDYRIIYTVQDDVFLVVGVDLGRRLEIYRRGLAPAPPSNMSMSGCSTTAKPALA